jgi:hypothetical protein
VPDTVVSHHEEVPDHATQPLERLEAPLGDHGAGGLDRDVEHVAGKRVSTTRMWARRRAGLHVSLGPTAVVAQSTRS